MRHIRPLTFLGACALVATVIAACDPPVSASTCDQAKAAAAFLTAYLDAAQPAADNQTASDLRAMNAAVEAACAPATTTTEVPTTDTTAPPTTQPAEPGAFPTEATTGVPAGWVPAQTITDQNLVITTPGTVVQDVRMVRGNIWVRAANVTIRRVEMQGGRINNSCCINQDPYDDTVAGTSAPGMLVEDVTFANPPGVAHTDDVYYRLGDSNYTARRIKILDQLEGFRSGGGNLPGAGEVTIEDSYVRLDTTTIVNVGCGGHPDGVQGYVGFHTTIRHNTIDLFTTGGSCENAAVFIADDSHGADVIGNLLLGGAFTLRPGDGPFTIQDNLIAEGTWQYGPAACGGGVGYSVVAQGNNHLATIASDYRVVTVGAEVRC